MSGLEMFALLYSDYPRHEARKDGEKAWLKLDPSPELFTKITEHVRFRKRTAWFGKEKHFIPLIGTFIRGERWEDEIDDIEPESKSEAIARKNREAAIEFDKQLFGADGDGAGPRDSEGPENAVLRRAKGSF